jgi:hypothetical protein
MRVIFGEILGGIIDFIILPLVPLVFVFSKIIFLFDFFREQSRT